ncbi:MAG: hypothetical protein HOV96_03885 [Nonomuraea sp.]|nr:hypothetical protein [Nonomuraea sp.]NUT39958.1 hypothetical protein [Thermoactinospora sp.]
MRTDVPGWIERTISVPRFAPYLAAFGGSSSPAWSLYQWNVEVSEAFYRPLHWLEISLRNAEHRELRERFERADWWHAAPLHEHDAGKVLRVENELRRRNNRPPRADDVVAELSFGFWVSLLGRRYDRHLWVPALHRAFPHYRGAREPLRDNLQAMLLLRNRIMHHEPVHHRHLAADHAKIYRLLGHVEPELVTWLRAIDRLPDVLARRPGGVR